MKAIRTILWTLVVAPLLIGCVKKVGDDTFSDTTRSVTTTTTTVSNQATSQNAYNYPVTLPVLDAFFADSGFASDLARNTGLTTQEVTRVKEIARKGTRDIRTSDTSSTYAARMETVRQLSSAIGQDKANRVVNYVETRWSGSTTSNASFDTKPNEVPSDTRIVVNIPEYRMDLFQNGSLVRSYQVTIGYPEFPLPTGLRSASTIIFNPPWTTPDEPWVQASTKVSVGETLEPGDKLNPLGIMKVPIGLPSLIHGGKSLAQIGNFGSHGCVGLTNDEARDFVKVLASMAGDTLTDKDIADDTKDKKSSKEVKLAHSVPVELRYETIVLENGKLHIMRDVYDHNSTTDTMLNAVLAAYGTSLSKLNPQEQSEIQQAIASMARDANGNIADGTNPTATPSSTRDTVGEKVQVTKHVKGAKEMVIPIAELAGKGYPEMMKQHYTSAGARKSR